MSNLSRTCYKTSNPLSRKFLHPSIMKWVTPRATVTNQVILVYKSSTPIYYKMSNHCYKTSKPLSTKFLHPFITKWVTPRAPVTKQVTLVYKISTLIYYEMSNPSCPCYKTSNPLSTKFIQSFITKWVTPCAKKFILWK